MPMLITVILTSFSGCGSNAVEPSVINEANITPTQAEPLGTKPTATNVVEVSTSVPEASPTAGTTPTPTFTMEESNELRGVSNGNSVSGTDTLYKDFVYSIMPDYDTCGEALYCTNIKGDIIHTLYQGFVHDINVYKDKVYFVSDGDTTDTYRCDLDGSNLEVINKLDIHNMIIYDNLIYAITWEDKKLVRFQLDGSNWEELSTNGCHEFIIEQSKIYYASYNELCSMNLDGSDKKQIYDEGSCYYVNYSDGWLYFSLNSNMYKITTDGTEFTTIREGNTFNLNVDDEYIYFIDIDKNRELRRMKKDGSEEIKLDEPRAYSISILGDYIRYSYGLDEDHAIYQIKKDGTEKKLIRNDIAHRYE